MFQLVFSLKSAKAAVGLGLLALSATAAFAQANGYSYAYSGPGISGSGDVYLNSTASDGVYSVASISGQVNGMTISAVLPAGTYNNNDNLFYDNDSFLDDSGVAFSLTNGANVDIYYDGDNYYFQGDGTFELDNGTAPQPEAPPAFRSLFRSFSDFNSDPAIELDSFTFAPLDTAATPEPSGLILMGTGLAGGLAGWARNRRRR